MTGRGGSLLRVLRLLRRVEGARYAPPLADLAREFEVSDRTIRRDLELLEEAGFAVPKYRDEYQRADR